MKKGESMSKTKWTAETGGYTTAPPSVRLTVTAAGADPIPDLRERALALVGPLLVADAEEKLARTNQYQRLQRLRDELTAARQDLAGIDGTLGKLQADRTAALQSGKGDVARLEEQMTTHDLRR